MLLLEEEQEGARGYLTTTIGQQKAGACDFVILEQKNAGRWRGIEGETGHGFLNGELAQARFPRRQAARRRGPVVLEHPGREYRDFVIVHPSTDALAGRRGVSSQLLSVARKYVCRVNGWTFWEYKLPGQDRWQILKSLRRSA